jgi:sugar transferase (PEP-CTERM system associated)
MTRLLGRHLVPEMAVLGVCDLALAFVLVSLMLSMPSPFALPAGSLAATGASLAALLAVSITLSAAMIGIYRPEAPLRSRRLIPGLALAALAAYPLLLLVCTMSGLDLSRPTILWLGQLLAGWFLCVLANRAVVSRVMPDRWLVRRVLVVGATTRAARMRDLARSARKPFEIVVTNHDDASQLAGAPLCAETLRTQRIWGVIVAGDEMRTEPNSASGLLDCKLRGVPVFDEAGFCEQQLGRIDLDGLSPERLLFADGFPNSMLSNFAKRFLDICTSFALLVLTLPVMLLTALAIRLDSRGSVLYRQQRVGLHGKTFTLFKFRSMTEDAEAGGRPRWALQRDPRITRIGRLIRPLRIDELPQLFNVLRGEMSMIGPRPERPHFVEQLARVIPFFHERSYVKPGITGWAQINYPYGASVEDAREKLSYDLYYVKNRSLLLDLFILLGTVRVILSREGAR